MKIPFKFEKVIRIEENRMPSPYIYYVLQLLSLTNDNSIQERKNNELAVDKL